jgi:hypothetical protein
MRCPVFIHDEDVLVLKSGTGGKGVGDFYGHIIS